jgi:NPH3 family
VPKDWWTEDISELDLELFRSIVYTVRSTKTLLPALIGEVLHVYICKHLPDPLYTDGFQPEPEPEEKLVKQKRILESIVTMLPPEPGSVTCRFLLRLLRIANFIGIKIFFCKFL